MRVESIAPYVHHKVYYHKTDMLSKSPRLLYLRLFYIVMIRHQYLFKTVFKSKTIMGQKKFHYRFLMICLEVSQ